MGKCHQDSLQEKSIMQLMSNQLWHVELSYVGFSPLCPCLQNDCCRTFDWVQEERLAAAAAEDDGGGGLHSKYPLGRKFSRPISRQ